MPEHPDKIEEIIRHYLETGDDTGDNGVDHTVVSDQNCGLYWLSQIWET